MTGLGYTLQVARQQQGLSLDEVSRATRLAISTLTALEAEAFWELPGSFYAKNAIRQYATFLDLPAERLLALYPDRDAPPPMQAPGWLTAPGSSMGVWLLVSGVVIIMLAMVYGLVQAYRPVDTGRQVGPVIVIAPATPTPAPTPTVEPTPAGTPTPTPGRGTPTATAANRTPTGTAGAATATPAGTPAGTPTVTPQAQSAVPAVTGLVAAEAEQRLRAAGFGVTRQEAFSASVPVGRVVEQNPPAGTQRPAGASVVIVVSRGAQGQVVPNVVGMQESQAIATLQNAGLRVNPNVNRQGRDQVPERVLETVCIGCVLSTSPAAGTTADASTVVNIAVRRE